MNKKNNVKIVPSVKMFLLFCVQSAMALIIFFLLIFNGKYGDGEVGMAPFMEMIILLILFIISIIIYFVTRKLINIKYHYVYIILSMPILVAILGIDRDSINQMIKNDLYGFFLRCSLLAQLISTVLALIAYFVVEKLKI